LKTTKQQRLARTKPQQLECSGRTTAIGGQIYGDRAETIQRSHRVLKAEPPTPRNHQQCNGTQTWYLSREAANMNQMREPHWRSPTSAQQITLKLEERREKAQSGTLTKQRGHSKMCGQIGKTARSAALAHRSSPHPTPLSSRSGSARKSPAPTFTTCSCQLCRNSPYPQSWMASRPAMGRPASNITACPKLVC
jgi:hypothetical protein